MPLFSLLDKVGMIGKGDNRYKQPCEHTKLVTSLRTQCHYSQILNKRKEKSQRLFRSYQVPGAFIYPIHLLSFIVCAVEMRKI